MKVLVTTLLTVVATTAFAASDEPSLVVLQDQHGNYTSMFIRSQDTRTTVALSVGGRGAGQRDDRNEQQQDYGQGRTSEYRSR